MSVGREHGSHALVRVELRRDGAGGLELELKRAQVCGAKLRGVALVVVVVVAVVAVV